MTVTSKYLFADLVLPLALQKLFTYQIPSDFTGQLKPGCRVVVQFGKSKMYTALVHAVHNKVPEHYQAKTILEILDSVPVVTENQLRLWEWMSEYYLCTLGEIMIAALPSVMKLQSESAVALNPEFVADSLLLTQDEELIINKLTNDKVATISEVSKLLKTKNSLRLIRDLVEKGVLVHHEEMHEKFKTRQISYVRLTALSEEENFMQDLFSKIEKRAPKQLELLMGFMKLKMDKERDFFPKSLLLRNTGASGSSLQQLVEKGVMEIFEAEESLSVMPFTDTGKEMELSDSQQLAYKEIVNHFSQNKVTLLHGVTSSGKTEVYINLISDMIDKGKQVLYMLPEIALTTQIISRLKSHFGDRLLVFHSRYSAVDRAEVYMKLLSDGTDGKFRFPIIVGARSSVFLPLKNPGLIIVDEEHDSSYKQNDPSPRYQARDTAVVIGTLNSCNVLLGSATPSLESFFNAEAGKYELVKMTERYGGIKLPEIKIIDLKDAYKKRTMKSHFSQQLLDGIKSALDNKEQVILFQNRRGFAPVIECKNCGWIPQCVNCDVTLTYHKRSNHLRCHYCGYTNAPPSKCYACGDADIRMKGMGTERIEDEISIFFPDHRIERLDLDTTSSRSAFQRIISGFENGEIDILVGTQMVTKGLDFDNVSLVGVLNADALINFPDFRASERSYQLLAQVSGRSGRKFRQGKVLIQTFQVDHPILQYVIHNNYTGFYKYETEEREKYLYPPYYRLIELRLKHRDEQLLDELSKEFSRELKLVFGKRVLGPVPPGVARVRNLYIRNILLKIEKNLPNVKVKEMIVKVTDRFLSHQAHRSLIIQMDVDPV